jgi:hypothetical protein
MELEFAMSEVPWLVASAISTDRRSRSICTRTLADYAPM